MVSASVEEFRATLRLTWDDPSTNGERIFSYWNNQSVTSSSCDREEVLHICRRTDGSFYLEIANLVHEGPLEQLEDTLYRWAADEGWLD